ncbi:GumC family protein [candidate division KSB1 bacterium]|nr:GumC family protein [candidate division KSB1 bacterium]
MHKQQFQIKRAIHILFRRKMIIISLFISVVLTVTIGSFLMAPTYQAASKVLIMRDSETEKALLFRINPGYTQDTNYIINSEVEIIRSRPIAERVIKQLGLDMKVELLLGKLDVHRLRDANVINISFETDHPAQCAQVVNSVVKNYVEYRAELFRDSDAYEFFSNQIAVADSQLSKLERRQASYQQEKNILSPVQQNQILLNKLAAYEQELTKARTERITRNTRLEMIQNLLSNGDSLSIIPSTEISDSPSQKDYLSRLKGELLSLEMEHSRLLEIYNPDYDEVVKIEKQITAAREQIHQEVDAIITQERTAIDALKAREDVLNTSIAGIHQQVRQRSEQEYQYASITRGIDDNREVYSMLLKQREEARISLAKMDNLVKVRVVSPAIVPDRPVKPKKKLNVLLSLFFGLAAGLSAAFVVDYFDRTLSNVEDVEQYLDLPVLTSIPHQR